MNLLFVLSRQYDFTDFLFTVMPLIYNSPLKYSRVGFCFFFLPDTHSNYCKSRSHHICADVTLPLSLSSGTRADGKFVLTTQGSARER